jgi:hypothetical protein
LLPSISLSPITIAIAKDHAMVHIILNRVTLLFISTYLAYSYVMGTSSPTATAGEQFVENTSSCTLN